MRLTFSNNPLDRFACWFENEVLTPISRYYYINKKKHYECCVCGHIIAPYFDDNCKCSPIYDMGWHKFNESWPRYICHHCADHGYSHISWDEWQEYIKEYDEKVLATIKNKDPEYYHYWFEGGREQELFGDDNDE